MRRTSTGFSLIEVMLVVVIIGILSAIAIPALLGSKKNAEAVGDAQQNAKSLQLALETNKADTGIYGAAGATATWDATGFVSGTNLAPTFAPKGSTKMTYTLAIDKTSALIYTLSVTDSRSGSAVDVYKTDQTGRQIYPVP